MTTTLMTDLTVADLCDGFVYSELEQKGLFGWGGRLVIQPEYQRNYIYADGKKDVAVVESLLKEPTGTFPAESSSQGAEGLWSLNSAVHFLVRCDNLTQRTRRTQRSLVT